MTRISRLARVLVLPALATAALACSGDDPTAPAQQDDLTSLSARSRSLRFDGYVYVSPSASDAAILAAVRTQTQTAFGALRTADIGVNSRELKDVDPKSFKKTNVTVVDTESADDPGTPMVKVRYRYKDTAVVPVAMAKRSAITLAVMGTGYKSQTSRILEECTENDSEAQEFSGSIWYVFDPSLSQCQDAIATEQKSIDEAQAKLADPKKQVSKREADRLYLPVTVALGADKTNKGKSFPEYDRLFTGGIDNGKLVIGLVNGFIDHGEHSDYTDSGYGEWMEELKESFAGHDWKLASIEPQEDLSKLQVGTKSVSGVSFSDFLRWEVDGSGFPSSIAYGDRNELRRQVGEKIIQHWLTFETQVEVSIGGAAAKPLTLQIVTYFGAGSDPAPHKRAIAHSDVFIYNGHSYIGYGPLDPSNFSAADFPASYQILFIDGCVSYNYYEKDYIPLKSGGTKNLDLITNGIEAPSYKSGYALGRFVSEMVSGTQPSYRDLLTAAEDTDALRVVDGELDNSYDPKKKPIVFQ